MKGREEGLAACFQQAKRASFFFCPFSLSLSFSRSADEDVKGKREALCRKRERGRKFRADFLSDFLSPAVLDDKNEWR